MRRLVVLTLMIILLVPAISIRAQQENTDFRCTLNGETVFPRYDRSTDRVVIVSWETGDEVSVLAADFQTDDFDIRGWSPDCRFLLVGIDNRQRIVVWNVPTAQQVGILESVVDYRRLPEWSPDSNFALVQTLGGGFLWNLNTNAQYQLEPDVDGLSRNFVTWQFDLARGQLLAVHISTDTAVTATDLNSGQTVATYDVDGVGWVNFELQGNEILVFSARGLDADRRLALWNRDSGAVQRFQLPRTRHLAFSNWAYSPDGRYLAIPNRDVFVWDLANFTETPLVQIPMRDLSLPFVRWQDGQTLEVVNYPFSSKRNPERRWRIELFRWTIPSAEELYFDRNPYSICFDDDFIVSYPEQSLLRWGCAV